MTTNDLATGYHRKCEDRLAALAVLYARAAFSDVVRESQEVVERLSRLLGKPAGQ